MYKKHRVGILGATGIVGYHLAKILSNHRWFKPVCLGSSPSKVGLTYQQGLPSGYAYHLPSFLRNQFLVACDPHFFDVDIVFSALPSEEAQKIEPMFIERGICVCSNSSYYRHSHYPLVIPELNASLLKSYISSIDKKTKGMLITNPNCVACPLALTLAPLLSRFCVKKVVLTALQSLSGAGFRHTASYDRQNHLIPYIAGEEEKIISETRLLLQSYPSLLHIPIEVTSVRITTPVGHTLILNIEIEEPNLTTQTIKETYLNWRFSLYASDLPMTVKPLFVLYDEKDMPQSVVLTNLQNRMQIHIGRIRLKKNQLSMVVLSDNLIRGAAGASIMNAECLYQLEYNK